MPYSVERLPPPAPLVKAADHSSDHNPRGQHQPPHQDVSRDPDGAPDETPAVVLTPSHQDAATLGGIAAYQATARHALDARAKDSSPVENAGTDTLDDGPDFDAPAYDFDERSWLDAPSDGPTD